MNGHDGSAPALRRRPLLGQWLAAAMLAFGRPAAASRSGGRDGLVLPLGGVDFLHRWSRRDQHEFTPAGQEDLARWVDMLTLNLHGGVRDGDALAALANGVLARYREHGKVLVTRSVPRTPARPAEHLIVAVLGQPQFLEAAFARMLLHDGTGLAVVRSHRIHGQAVGPAMSRWLAAEGPRQEQALMAWAALPPLARLQALPVS